MTPELLQKSGTAVSRFKSVKKSETNAKWAPKVFAVSTEIRSYTDSVYQSLEDDALMAEGATELAEESLEISESTMAVAFEALPPS